jgi:hypothetical protein
VPDPGAADVERKRWHPAGDLIDSRRARDEFTTPPLSRHQLFRRLKQTSRDRLIEPEFLDLRTVVSFFRAYGRPVVTRVELDTEQMTPKKWKSCRAHRHHQPCRRSG